MASTSSIIQAMNNITLDDEEEGGLALEVETGGELTEGFKDFNIQLCLVGRFITEGVMEFQAMHQTMTALWRPGKGVYIKEIDTNLYLFQLYQELHIKRVIDGSPWSFNRKALIIALMKEGDIPRGVNLNTLDLWIQVHDLRASFMTEKVLKEVGNYIGTYMESCSSNFTGVWREYLRVRVTVDLTKPLKRRMKVRKSGDEWFWILLKYENIPTFCFICGLLGHSEKFCSRLFDTPETEITKPYCSWMRAPFRRHIKPIGAKWLCDESGNRNSTVNGEWTDSANFTPPNQDSGLSGENLGCQPNQNNMVGGKPGGLTDNVPTTKQNQSNPKKAGIPIVENKKRKIVIGPTSSNEANNNTKLDMGSEEENTMCLDQDTQDNSNMDNMPKNVRMARSATGVRQEL